MPATINQQDKDLALRNRAEAELRSNKIEASEQLSSLDATVLLHELQVHQIELEMQNDELKSAHIELEALHSRYFELYDLAPVGYLTLNEKWQILESNLAAAKLLGVLTKNLTRQPLSHSIFPEDRDIFYHHCALLQNTGLPQTCEVRILVVTGGSIWVKVESVATEKGEKSVPSFRVVLSDISISKQAEEELNLFFNLVPDLVCIASVDGYFKRLNKTWEEVLGFSQNELLAVPFKELIHPDDWNETLTEVVKQRGGVATKGFINRYRCKDGSYRWFEWMSVSAIDKILMFAVARDITRRVQLEGELLKNIEAANVTNKTMSRLLCTIVHDYCTPLDLASGSTEVMARNLDILTSAFQEQESVLLKKKLTRREREVLLLVGQGISSKNIAEQMGVCLKTIEMHRSNLMKKLGTANAASLARWAIIAAQMIIPPLIPPKAPVSI